MTSRYTTGGSSSRRRLAAALIAGFFFSILAQQADAADGQGAKYYGDFRYRFEQDWDSDKTNGSQRDDRSRLRYRLRFGFNYQWDDHFSFGGRLRSGNPADQQSPHITLGNEFEPADINIDKAFLKGNYGSSWWWVGKNSLPFWKQNEMFWDDDVTAEGLALGRSFAAGNKLKLKATAGYFIIGHSGMAFSDDATMTAAQVALEGLNLGTAALKLASGYYLLSDIPDQNDGTATSVVDYKLLVSGAQLGLKGGLPLTLGLDFMLNTEDYADHPTIGGSNLEDETTGFVVSVKYGSLNARGDTQFRYYFASIGKYAVVDYFAQDDWVRWNYSGASGARSSNFQGHELRCAYAFGPKFNAVARLYLVEAKEKKSAGDLALESGNRFRLDFNIGF
jgi:hypothetical protein